MKKILVLSVGGSSEPIITAIRNCNPDFVYFFCSSGPRGSDVTIDSQGNPCGDKRRSECPECGHKYHMGNPRGKAIVFQAGLEKDQYKIVTIDDPDNLNECYQKLLDLVDTIKEKHSECRVIANYTGGTKTMSVAIALVSIMTQQWDLSLNIGPRLDLIKVRAGDVPVVVDKWSIFCRNQLDFLRTLLDNHYYAFVASSISHMLSQPLDKTLQNKLVESKLICEAFDLWDKFNHQKALELLEPNGSRVPLYIINLKRIVGKSKASGYELVSDLLNNAERKAFQKHYDDAIARLYRATELFAQIRLEKEYGYKTGELSLKQLPEHIREVYKGQVRNDKLVLGLREDYELLLKLGDPFGKKYKENEGSILNALYKRNSSIGAHGKTPLSEDDYNLVKNKLKGFILESANKIGLKLDLKQFPGRSIL